MIEEIKYEELNKKVEDGFHIVDIYGTHCIPCKQLEIVLKTIDNMAPHISILKLNSDENSQAVKDFNIMSVPTILFYKDGEIVHEVVGLIGKEDIFEIASDYMY